MKVRFGQAWKKRVTHVPLGSKDKQLKEPKPEKLGRAQGENKMVSHLPTMREQMQGVNFESGIGCDGESITSVNSGIIAMQRRCRPQDKAEAGLYYSAQEYTALRNYTQEVQSRPRFRKHTEKKKMAQASSRSVKEVRKLMERLRLSGVWHVRSIYRPFDE
jgi:hypothetical protein